jgi:hypothetical protein
LILDGQGDSNALFIIKINGALSTSAFSKVILINSAYFNNVYWQVNGQFTAGDSSVFRGSIISDGAISLLEGSSLYGRGISIAGAISLHNNLVEMEFALLPIELMSFTANKSGADVQLNWATASETNNDYFTVQRSDDGISFDEVSRISGAGNSNTMLYYSLIDLLPYEGISYYRLMQTDFDGMFAYSALVSIDLETSIEVNIYPNPFITYTTIALSDATQIHDCELKIYNGQGKEVMNTALTEQLTTIQTSDLSSGVYFYKLFDNFKTIQTGKLVSNH